MAQKILTTANIRTAINGLRLPELTATVSNMSDKALLKAEFETDLGLDSLDVTELTMNLEKDLDISFPDSSFHRFKRDGNTVQAMLKEYNRVLATTK